MTDVTVTLTTTRDIAGHAQAGISRHMDRLAHQAAMIRLHPTDSAMLFGRDDVADVAALRTDWLACDAACRALSGLPPQFPDIAAAGWDGAIRGAEYAIRDAAGLVTDAEREAQVIA